MTSPTNSVNMEEKSSDTNRQQLDVSMASSTNNANLDEQDITVPEVSSDVTADNIVSVLNQSGATVNLNTFNIQQANITSKHTQIGSHNRMTSQSSEEIERKKRKIVTPKKISGNLQKLFDKTNFEIEAWRTEDQDVFVSTPALEECQQKLNGHGRVAIFGLSGDGKTTLGYRLVCQSGRRAVIIRDPAQWEEIDVTMEQIIMLDDMLGRFVLDEFLKQDWEKRLKNMSACVQKGNIQIIITCRETVFAVCKKQLQQYDLFKPETSVHLNDPKSTCSLTFETKFNMIKKYIQSKHAFAEIRICDKPKTNILPSENNTMYEINERTLKQIAEIESCLGFPQCCRFFVSNPECFSRGLDFFKRPTEMIIQEIDRMRESGESGNEKEQYSYFVLVCVLIFGELTDVSIDDEDDTLKNIARLCGIVQPTIYSKTRMTAQRLVTSYLSYTSESYKFRHNSLMESVFSSFFTSSPKLLIEHCSFYLIKSLITTEYCTEKSAFCCELPKRYETNMCERLVKEAINGNIREVASHKVFTDEQFVCKFCSFIGKSDHRHAFFDTEYQKKSGAGNILRWSAVMSHECFVNGLISVMRNTVSADRVEHELSKALEHVCFAGRFDIYKLLTKKHRATVTDKCLELTTHSGNKDIIDGLLQLEKWTVENISCALYIACSFGIKDIFKSLVEHKNGVGVTGECLSVAVDRGYLGMVEQLLSSKSWDVQTISDEADRSFRCQHYDICKLLLSQCPEVTMPSERLVQAATRGLGDIVMNLLQRQNWSREDVLYAMEAALEYSNDEVYKLLVEKGLSFDVKKANLTAAARKGDLKIVNYLMQIKRWHAVDIFSAMVVAAESGNNAVHKLLVEQDFATRKEFKESFGCLPDKSDSGFLDD